MVAFPSRERGLGDLAEAGDLRIGRAGHQVVGVGQAVIYPPENAQSAFPQDDAKFGRLHPPLGAAEQLAAEFPFRFLNRHRQWRLSDVWPFGHPAKVELLGENDKMTELPQIY